MTLDELSYIMGVLPGSYKLELSEPTEDGKRDYIIEPSVLRHTQSDANITVGKQESNNPILKTRQLAFLDVLKAAAEANEKDDDVTDLLCLENDATTNHKTFDLRRLPKEHIPSVADLQKKIQARRVVHF